MSVRQQSMAQDSQCPGGVGATIRAKPLARPLGAFLDERNATEG